MSMKNSSGLPACSAVPRPNASPRASEYLINSGKFRKISGSGLRNSVLVYRGRWVQNFQKSTLPSSLM